MISPLQLNNYFIKELSYRSNQAYDPEAKSLLSEGKIHCTLELGTALSVPDLYMVALVIAVEPSEVRPALDAYHIKIRIEGFFNFKPEADVSQAQKDKLVQLNGSSILMGLARGLVAQATGVSEFGKYLLPAVNFVEILKATEQGTTDSKGSTNVPAMAGGEKA
jgi:preprotein translocase subunit SecB